MPTVEDFIRQAQALLPHGPAWTRSPAARLTMLLEVFAVCYYEASGRADMLVKEANPLTTDEMLTDWERLTGLPDTYEYIPADARTREDRRSDVVTLLTSNLAATLAVIKAYLRHYGYSALIRESEDQHDTLILVVDRERVLYARCGIARCGDRLSRILYDTELEHKLNRIKPAHVTFVYEYPDPTDPSNPTDPTEYPGSLLCVCSTSYSGGIQYVALTQGNGYTAGTYHNGVAQVTDTGLIIYNYDGLGGDYEQGSVAYTQNLTVGDVITATAVYSDVTISVNGAAVFTRDTAYGNGFVAFTRAQG
jgi:uncharacterized protein YmfQ (DUF2313 family)